MRDVGRVWRVVVIIAIASGKRWRWRWKVKVGRCIIIPYHTSYQPPIPRTDLNLQPTIIISSLRTMILAKAAITLSLGCTAARAFSPAARCALFSPMSAVSSSSAATTATSRLSRSFVATTALRANVLKLTEPSKDLLSSVDVFIFDCDGVIWRVSTYQIVHAHDECIFFPPPCISRTICRRWHMAS